MVEDSQQKQDVGPSTATRDHTPLSRPGTIGSLPDIQNPDSDGPLLITQRRGGGSEGGTKSNSQLVSAKTSEKLDGP